MTRILFILTLLLGFAVVAAAQQRPLITEDVDIIPPGSMRIEAGIDFMQGAKYTVSGLKGDLTRVGVIGVSFGMGPNVEFQIEGVAQNYLSINSRGVSAIPLDIAPGANSTNGTGDFNSAAAIAAASSGCATINRVEPACSTGAWPDGSRCSAHSKSPRVTIPARRFWSS